MNLLRIGTVPFLAAICHAQARPSFEETYKVGEGPRASVDPGSAKVKFNIDKTGAPKDLEILNTSDKRWGRDVVSALSK